jgi:hypothetical protein
MSHYAQLSDSQFARFRQEMIAKAPARANDWHCVCGNASTCPMLIDDLWAAIARGDRFLCWPCVEMRLGRELVKEDLRPRRSDIEDAIKKRKHGPAAAGAGDLGAIDDGDLLGPCPSCATALSVGHAKNPHTNRVERVIIHPMPFCSYYGETDPATIENDVRHAQEDPTS